MNKHFNLQLITDGDYKNKGFFLDDYYHNWKFVEDNFGRLILVAEDLSPKQKLEREQINIQRYNELVKLDKENNV